MDHQLNFVLFWLVAVSLGLNVINTWRFRRFQSAGWWLVFALVGGLLISGHFFWPQKAGFAAGIGWAMLMVVPLALIRAQSALAARHRWRLARGVAHLSRLLHPFDGWWHLPQLLRALELLQKGQTEEAVARFRRIHHPDTPIGWTATAQLLRVKGQWQGIRNWVEQGTLPSTLFEQSQASSNSTKTTADSPAAGLAHSSLASKPPPTSAPWKVADQLHWRRVLGDFSVAFYYLRALGELGDREALLLAYRRLLETHPDYQSPGAALDSLRMLVLSFCGRVHHVKHLLGTQAMFGDETLQRFWLATARLTSGDIRNARDELQRLGQSCDPLTRHGIQRRLEHPIPRLDPSALSQTARGVLEDVEKAAISSTETGGETIHSPPEGPTTLVKILLTYNVGVFLWVEFRLSWGLLMSLASGDFSALAELQPGGTTDQLRLLQYGALAVPEGEFVDRAAFLARYWTRLITANFLHCGWLHLSMNMAGLWLFGRYIERLLDPWRLFLCYTAAGIGAMLTVALGLLLFSDQGGVTVGASGSLMGLVGLTAMISLKQWLRHRSDVTWHQVSTLGLLLALQMVFDFFTPEVSETAHLGGLFIGIFLGSLFRLGPPPGKKPTLKPLKKSSQPSQPNTPSQTTSVKHSLQQHPNQPLHSNHAGNINGGSSITPSAPNNRPQTPQGLYPSRPAGAENLGAENPGAENPGAENPGAENLGAENLGHEKTVSKTTGTETTGTETTGTETADSHARDSHR